MKKIVAVMGRYILAFMLCTILAHYFQITKYRIEMMEHLDRWRYKSLLHGGTSESGEKVKQRCKMLEKEEKYKCLSYLAFWWRMISHYNIKKNIPQITRTILFVFHPFPILLVRAKCVRPAVST